MSYIPAIVFLETVIDQIESRDVHVLKLVCRAWKDAVEFLEPRIVRNVIANEFGLSELQKYDNLDPDFNLPRLSRVLQAIPEVVARRPRGKYKARLRPLVDGSIFWMTRTIRTDEFIATSSILCDLYKRIHAQYGDMSLHPWTRTHVSRWFLHLTLDYMFQRLFVQGGLSPRVYAREDVKHLRQILKARAVENMFELAFGENYDADHEGRDLTMGLLTKILTTEAEA